MGIVMADGNDTDNAGLYKKYLDLIELGEVDNTLWAKAIVLANGDLEKAKYGYVKLCVQRDESIHAINTETAAEHYSHSRPFRENDLSGVLAKKTSHCQMCVGRGFARSPSRPCQACKGTGKAQRRGMNSPKTGRKSWEPKYKLYDPLEGDEGYDLDTIMPLYSDDSQLDSRFLIQFILSFKVTVYPQIY